jgi:hypothetical protein
MEQIAFFCTVSIIYQLNPQTSVNQYRILFDEAHNPIHYIIEPDSWSSYPTENYRLYMELIGLGHAVDILRNNSLIDHTFLSNYDLLVIPGSLDNYYHQEIDAIEGWVTSGGNILIQIDSTAQGEQDALAIAQRFGFEFSQASIFDYDDGDSYRVIDIDNANILPHILTTNVHKLVVSDIHGIITKPYNAEIILKTDGDGTAYYRTYPDVTIANDVPFMSVINNISGNGGRLVVLPVANIWDTSPNHNYNFPFFYVENNRQLTVNTFNWLVDRNNAMSIDSDNDTLPDYQELYALHSNPNSNDTDQDNLLDIFEYENGMSLISNDTDTDGLFDFDELYNYPTNPTKWDTDEDQLGDGDEYFVYGTNATNRDTDTDGIPDGFEVFNLMDPLDETDAELDYDNDQLTNLQEYRFGGNVYSNDTDADGLSDSDELYIYFTKIYRNDTDFDGLMDWDEIFIYHTDPRYRDTDGDGYPDRLEILEGFDPLDPNDPVPRPGYSEPIPSVKISLSVFSLLAINPLVIFVLYIKRKKMMRN